jgi:glycerol-3-phosphate acyltransferase PlsY
MMISALVVMEGIKPQNNSNLIINILLFAIFGLIWFAHRSNITRLLLGTENKVNLQKSLEKSLQKKEREEIENEYKQNKEQIKMEYKVLKQELKRDVTEKKKTYKLEKKLMSKKIKLSQNDIMLKSVKISAENGENKAKKDNN